MNEPESSELEELISDVLRRRALAEQELATRAAQGHLAMNRQFAFVLDGIQLTANEQKHLESCPDCQRALTRLQTQIGTKRWNMDDGKPQFCELSAESITPATAANPESPSSPFYTDLIHRGESIAVIEQLQWFVPSLLRKVRIDAVHNAPFWESLYASFPTLQQKVIDQQVAFFDGLMQFTKAYATQHGLTSTASDLSRDDYLQLIQEAAYQRAIHEVFKEANDFELLIHRCIIKLSSQFTTAQELDDGQDELYAHLAHEHPDDEQLRTQLNKFGPVLIRGIFDKSKRHERGYLAEFGIV